MEQAPIRLEPGLEAEYRRHHLATDSGLFVLGVIIWVITFTGFAYSDYLQLGYSSTFILLAAVRALYALLSLLVLLAVKRRPLDVKTFDTVSLVWSLATVALDIGIGLLRPRTDISVVINDLVGVFSFYIFISGRMTSRVIPGLALSAANLILILFYKQDVSGQVVMSLCFTFTITNLVGIMFSRQYFDMRRKEFIARKEEARVHAELKRLASTDPLTGVYNRRRLLELAGEAFYRYRRYSRPFTILVMDLDGFKNVNDTFGHQQGDEVLISFVRALNEEKRKADALGRMGGDEFCLVLPETTPEAAARLADRILHVCGDMTLTGNGQEVHVTTSIGITQPLPGDSSLDPLFARADAALYRAKHKGRNRYEVV